MLTPSEILKLNSAQVKFSIIYSIIVIAEIVTSSLEDFASFNYFFKPAIVISLLIFFLLKSKTLNKSLRLIITSALLFSLIGDVLLMFVDLSTNYFLFGLISFLLAHIMYVIAFLKHKNNTLNPIGFILILILYATSLFYILKDGLHDMLIPVIVYMLVILGMSTAAFLRRGNVPKLSYKLVFFGALFFMISDSILAMNKFYAPLPFSNISIMLTYALAQYLIVIGILKVEKD